MKLVYRCSMVICEPLWPVFRTFWRSLGYCNTNDIVYLVYASGGFFVYSSVSHGIGVPLFLGDLCTPVACFLQVLAQPRNIAIVMISAIWCTPQVRFSYILAFLVELVYCCFLVICAVLWRVFRTFWRSLGTLPY